MKSIEIVDEIIECLSNSLGDSLFPIDLLDIPFERKVKELNIYDFDGTLFRSPEPSPPLWDNKTLGRILGQPCEGGLGWYQDTITLSKPYVNVQKGEEDTWWNKELLIDVRRSMSNPHSLTVLLTGRSTAYLNLIKSMATDTGIVFDEYYTKPVSLDVGTKPVRTMNFKLDTLRSLILRFSPDYINLYEDRPAHVDKFREFTKEINGRCNYAVHPIKIERYHLSEAQELDVVNYLVTKYLSKDSSDSDESNSSVSGSSKKSDVPPIEHLVLYTGVFLDDTSKEILLSTFPPPEEWEIKAHHMTMCLNALDPSKEPFVTIAREGEEEREKGKGSSLFDIGREANLTVVAIGNSEKALAVKVETDVPCKNKIKHVTIAVSPKGKAKDSNNISEWTHFEETDPRRITLQGQIAERTVYSIKRTPKQSKQTTTSKTLKINFGTVIRKHHPDVPGPMIGKAVKRIKDWMKESISLDISEGQDSTDTLQQIEDFIAALSLDEL